MDRYLDEIYISRSKRNWLILIDRTTPLSVVIWLTIRVSNPTLSTDVLADAFTCDTSNITIWVSLSVGSGLSTYDCSSWTCELTELLDTWIYTEGSNWFVNTDIPWLDYYKSMSWEHCCGDWSWELSHIRMDYPPDTSLSIIIIDAVTLATAVDEWICNELITYTFTFSNIWPTDDG